MFPDSGVLKATGLLEQPGFRHNNVNLGCAQCHGTFVVAQSDGGLSGWPNTGIGRVNPDGSLGSCSSCHTRHKFSVEEARKPETCGQCHLGPDHPQIEIYEESKHGNIYASGGETWVWDSPAGKWGPEQIEAPTCAACHLSGFGGVLPPTHDVGERLFWELQPAKSVPQWKNAEQVADLVRERVPDKAQAAEGRKRMKSVCLQCHSPRWVDGYFTEFDRVVEDYNTAWDYVDRLLQAAYAQGLAAKDNPLDEPAEIYHYLIWHHSGRRWRMGAAMMGPDWAHWNGAVDTLLINLGLMRSELESNRK
jgi:cytochrome c553